MGLLEQKIIVNKDSYADYMHYSMSDSMRDVYNAFLSQFISISDDLKYNDGAHQYLMADDGKTYYFDSFKYIYPADGSSDKIKALNSNIGFDNVSIVELDGSYVIIQEWDFRNSSVNFSLNAITDETIRLINEGYGSKVSMGYFLQQVSGHNVYACESLKNVSNASVIYDVDRQEFVAESDQIDDVYYASNLRSNSFYDDVMSLYDYRSLLNGSYLKKKDFSII